MKNNNSKPVLLLVDGELVDLNSAHSADVSVQEIAADHPSALETFRHSGSHLLAQAVTELYPGVQYGIGPAVESGFYYDFLTREPFSPEDLEKITKRMKHLVKQNLPIQREQLPREEAIALFKQRGQTL